MKTYPVYLIFSFVFLFGLAALISARPAEAQSEEPEYTRPDRRRVEPPVGLGTEASLAGEPLAAAGFGLESWTKFVYQSFRDGNWEIYVASGDLSSQNNLSRSPAIDAQPHMNRGGRKVVFESNRDGNYEIYSVNVDGSDLRRLTDHPADDYSAQWSPDGKMIAFVSEREGYPTIYTMNADGSEQRRIARADFPLANPAWSPDGKKIAMVGIDRDTAYTVNAAGGEIKHAMFCPYMFGIAWEPNGENALFVDCDRDGDYWNEIVRLDLEISKAEVVADANEDFVEYWLGSPSPTGEQVVFTRVEYILRDGRLYIDQAFVEAFQIAPARGAPVRLTRSGVELNPKWQTLDSLPPASKVLSLPEYSTINQNIILQWNGWDRGYAGVKSYDIEYRIGASGEWKALHGSTNTPFLCVIYYIEERGNTVYFRSRARDRAYNLEEWPENPDAWIRVPLATFSGSLMDWRGYPLQQAVVEFSSSPTEAVKTGMDGKFKAHFDTTNHPQIKVNYAGYGELPPIIANYEYTYIHLPPKPGLVANGNFEEVNDLDGWQTEGDFDIVRVTDGSSGEYSVGLSNFRYFGSGSTVTEPFSTTLMMGEISQVIAIPEAMNAPGLSFSYWYAYSGYSPQPCKFGVFINDEEILPLVYTDSWKHTWVDLEPYKGSSIKIGFRVENTPYDFVCSVRLDEIAAGPWMTPLVMEISETQFTVSAGKVITISGENFIQTPAVKIGDKAASKVVYVDEHTLKVTLPAGIPAGEHLVWVTNPGGAWGVAPQRLRTGYLLHLPVMGR